MYRVNILVSNKGEVSRLSTSLRLTVANLSGWVANCDRLPGAGE